MGLETGEIELPETVPVMVLEGATLFPKTMLPLYIFEPRYRSMLELALVTDRLLVVVQPVKGHEDRLCSVAGVGVIRACVKKEDGSSHLILQGIQRVLLTGWTQLLPFRVASVEAFGRMEDETPDQKRSRLVHLKLVLERGGLPLPKDTGEQLVRIDDPDVLTDIAASALLTNPEQRQAVLQELSNVGRQDLLLRFLRKNLE